MMFITFSNICSLVSEGKNMVDGRSRACDLILFEAVTAADLWMRCLDLRIGTDESLNDYCELSLFTIF